MGVSARGLMKGSSFGSAQLPGWGQIGLSEDVRAERGYN